ncbi:MAG TPA: cupin domain-containing protein [Candidatus Omnitrophota bacterium]|nr:cupin domain-containing protein [Candidatus Omnitrophota bacterium]
MRWTMDTSRVEAEWKKRGFSFGVWTDPPGQVWENYVHDTDELFMVLEGKVELEMRGQRFYPAAGEEVLIPAKEVHCVRNVGKGVSKWFYGYKK